MVQLDTASDIAAELEYAIEKLRVAEARLEASEKLIEAQAHTISLDHLSYSSISGWLMCPRGWKFGRADNVPHKTATNLVFGSAFHDTVEDRVRNKVKGINTPIALCWASAWAAQIDRNNRGADIDWRDTSPDEYDMLGRRMLANPTIRNVIDSITPLMTKDEFTWEPPPRGQPGHPTIEKLVELNIPGIDIPLIGYVDIIGDDFVPIDLKTSSQRWNQDKADKQMQATLYLAALEQMGFKNNPERLFRYYIFTKTSKPVAQVLTTERSQKQIDWALQAVRDVYDAIKKGCYPPNDTGWKCSEKWCEFHSHCHS